MTAAEAAAKTKSTGAIGFHYSNLHMIPNHIILARSYIPQASHVLFLLNITDTSTTVYD